MAREYEGTAEPEDYGYGKRAEELAHRMGERGAPAHTVVDPVKLLCLPCETAFHEPLRIEGLYDPQAADGFFSIREYLSPFVLGRKRFGTQFLADRTHDPSHNREHDEHKYG